MEKLALNSFLRLFLFYIRRCGVNWLAGWGCGRRMDEGVHGFHFWIVRENQRNWLGRTHRD